MEILKRAKGIGDGEMASWGYRPPAGLQDELNLRTYRAGYTDRDGKQKKRLADTVVSVPYGKTKLNVWPRDKHGKLIE